MDDQHVSIALDCEPTGKLSQEWAVYEQDGSSIVRYRCAEGHLYEQRNGAWFRLEAALEKDAVSAWDFLP